MRIGADLDGCLADYVTGHVALVHQLTGKIIPTPVTCYDYHKQESLGPNKPTPEENAQVFARITAGGFWQSLPALPFASAVIEQLDFHDTYYITQRPGGDAKIETERWLMANGAWCPSVLISGNEESKGFLAKGLGLEMFFDDKPSNCLAVKAALPTCRVFLVDATWNRGNWERASCVSQGIEIATSALDAIERAEGNAFSQRAA